MHGCLRLAIGQMCRPEDVLQKGLRQRLGALPPTAGLLPRGPEEDPHAEDLVDLRHPVEQETLDKHQARARLAAPALSCKLVGCKPDSLGEFPPRDRSRGFVHVHLYAFEPSRKHIAPDTPRIVVLADDGGVDAAGANCVVERSRQRAFATARRPSNAHHHHNAVLKALGHLPCHGPRLLGQGVPEPRRNRGVGLHPDIGRPRIAALAVVRRIPALHDACVIEDDLALAGSVQEAEGDPEQPAALLVPQGAPAQGRGPPLLEVLGAVVHDGARPLHVGQEPELPAPRAVVAGPLAGALGEGDAARGHGRAAARPGLLATLDQML
mmetsp:Transcript_61342/g.197651  ORF Transcript_61342/g.197651 Transcript_61342/m.197651 type:complete len:324 (-) Transcript_61342:7-978(-)